MTQSYTEKSVINGIGKFGTLSELLKRNLDIQVTFGKSNAANTNTITINNIRTIKILVKYPDGDKKSILVKTSRNTHFVTKYWQTYYDSTQAHPDYWVIVHIDQDEMSHYYILTHDELGTIQAEQDGHPNERLPNGCDNISLKLIAGHENRWDKIAERR